MMRSLLSIALVVLVLPFATGCLDGDVPAAQGKDATNTNAVRTPEDLADSIRGAREELAKTTKLYNSVGGQFRRDRIESLIATGIESGEALATLEEATPEQQAAGLSAKAEFIYKGVQQELEGFDVSLAELRDELIETSPQNPLTAVVDAMVIETTTLSDQNEFSDVMAVLQEHASRFPRQPSGVALYRTYAEQLRKAKLTTELKQCCQAGLGTYGDHPQAKELWNLLSKVQLQEQKEAEKKRTLHRMAARLGGHYDGYFVIYSHPKTVAYLSPVDYRSVHGLEDVTAFLERTEKKGWKWNLEGWFPEGEDGRRQASELARKLIKKNTISMPTFR